MRAARVLIVIDAFRVTGPAKGILQLCDASRGRFTPRLAVIERGCRGASPLRQACEVRGLDAVVLVERRRFDPSPLHRAWRLARAWRADVVQTHGYKPTVVGRVLRRALGVPWIAFSHGRTAENATVRLYHCLDERLMRSADRVVVVSDAMRRGLSARGFADERLVTVPNAVALPLRDDGSARRAARRALDLPERTPVLAAVGRLSAEKGQRVLVDAMIEVAHAAPDALLLLVGDGPDDAALRARAAAVPGHPIRFLGYRADVTPVYDAADAIVLPSLSEGLPNVALEAMAHGRPVIASAVGGVPEVVDDGATGLLVPPGEPGPLARALIALLRDDGLRAALGAAGRARVETRFSVAARAARILSLYDDLVSPPRSSLHAA